MSKQQISTESQLSLALRAKNGVSVDELFKATELLGFDNSQVEEIYQTTVKTLRFHRQAGKPLSAVQGEQTLKLNILCEKGEEVFGEMAAFRRWLSKPAHGLDNQLPFSLLSTSGGIDAVIQELEQIAYGELA